MEQCQIGPTWTNILLMNIPSKYCMFTKRPSWHEGFHHSVLFIDTGKQSVGFVGQLQKSHTFHRWRDSLGHRPKLKTRFSSDYLYYRFHMVPCLKFKDGSSMSAYISTQCKRERERERGEKRVEKLAQDENTKGVKGYLFPAPGLLATALLKEVIH